MVEMGLRYADGKGVPRSIERAADAFLWAAEYGSEMGMLSYAAVYVLSHRLEVTDVYSGDLTLYLYAEMNRNRELEFFEAYAWLNIAAVCEHPVVVRLRDDVEGLFDVRAARTRAGGVDGALRHGHRQGAHVRCSRRGPVAGAPRR